MEGLVRQCEVPSLDRALQSQVSFLDQVEQLQLPRTSGALLRDVDHQSQVRVREPPVSAGSLTHQMLEIALLSPGAIAHGFHTLLREYTDFDRFGEVHFLTC